MYGAKTVGTWVPSAPPQKGAPDQQAATPAPGGCQHQQVLYLQHTQMTLSPTEPWAMTLCRAGGGAAAAL